MRILVLAGLLAICSAPILDLTLAQKPTGEDSPLPVPLLVLHEKRTSPTDLELSGDVPATSSYNRRYVAYSDLLKLPHVTFMVTDDSNFHSAVRITGIYLDELMRAFNIPEKDTMIGAVCDDGYEAHYPVDYREAHHPILVLTVNDKQLALTKRMADGGSYGPYLISHAVFTSRYHTLAHPEEAQIPNGVVGLRFLREDDVFRAIQPRENYAPGSPQMQGYLIARENCFRCHNAGAYGGRKAGIPWGALATMARTRSDYFEAYIKDPESESPYAEMPGFPDYDEATLSALTAYFRAVSKGTRAK
jgi:hypothetical protein